MDGETPIRFCGGIFFTLILKARKKPVRNQEEILKDLLVIFDRGVKGMYGNTLTTYASKFKNCDPDLDTEYIKFGDEVVLAAFNDRLKNEYEAVLEEIKAFVTRSLDVETNGKWLVRAILEMIEADAGIKENVKFHIMPGNIPVYKSDLRDLKMVYFYNFLLGVWQYICTYCVDNGVGADTYIAITEDAGKNKGRKVKNGIGMQGYKDIEISYSTEQEIPKTLEGFKKLAKTGSFDALAMAPALNQMLKPKKQEERKETIEIVWTESKHKSFFDRINRYATYLEHAKNKYKDQRTFLYETRRPFYDFFVCNDIKRRISTPLTGTVYYSSGKDNPLITDACIEKFPQDHHFIILSGTGGLGKSMMMTHFMLDSIKKNCINGMVPIFVNIRDYDPREGDVTDFFFSAFRRHDPELRLPDLMFLLSHGKAVLLMDGLDELKGEKRDKFSKEINYLADSYPDSVYVISSRPTMNFRAYERFSVYDLQPFSQKQAVAMIGKLDDSVIDPETQKDFIKDIESNRFSFNYDERVEFLGNPLFLTIMLLAYAETHDIPKQRYKFYEEAYAAMAKKHDATKNLTREFATGLDEDKFKYYFGEFCAITYEQEKYDFTPAELDDYFQMVIDMNDLDTYSDRFIDDITGKICLLYQDGTNYYFVHRSFQEYFAAYFFSKQLEQNFDAVLDMLLASDESNDDSMVLPMLYAMDNKKTELCIFIPFLKEIFEREDSNNIYRDFLYRLYPTIMIAQGDTDDYYENDSDSAIYRFFVDEYGLHEIIDGDKLPWIDTNVTWEFTYYNANWKDRSKPEKLSIIKECDIPDEYKEIYGDEFDIVGHVNQIEPLEIYNSPYKYLKATVDILEDETFPLKIEFRAVKKKYEELKVTYEKKKDKKDWISRFH